jgi:hypothetical protein
VTDAAGNGLANMQIRFRVPNGEQGTVTTKDRPDPPGTFNIPSPDPGGTWVLYMLDAGGKRASPDSNIVAPQSYSGAGNCPTRIDFRAQK